jgi:hypothetical protein
VRELDDGQMGSERISRYALRQRSNLSAIAAATLSVISGAASNGTRSDSVPEFFTFT